MRVKRGFKARRRRNRVLKLAKGFRGRRKNCYKRANQAVERALNYSTRDRRQKRRDFRALWIVRINAAARQNGTTYSKLVAALKKAGVAPRPEDPRRSRARAARRLRGRRQGREGLGARGPGEGPVRPMPDLLSQLEALSKGARDVIARAGDEKALEELRVRFLGKKGELSAVLRGMGQLSAEERPRVGEVANRVKDEVEALLEAARARLGAAKLEAELAGPPIDVTLPGRGGSCRAATATRSPGPPRRSPASSRASATRSRAGRRSSSTGTTSRRSTSRRTTPPATCRTPSTWTSPRCGTASSPARSCCARTPRPCRSGR